MDGLCYGHCSILNRLSWERNTKKIKQTGEIYAEEVITIHLFYIFA